MYGIVPQRTYTEGTGSFEMFSYTQRMLSEEFDKLSRKTAASHSEDQ